MRGGANECARQGLAVDLHQEGRRVRKRHRAGVDMLARDRGSMAALDTARVERVRASCLGRERGSGRPRLGVVAGVRQSRGRGERGNRVRGGVSGVLALWLANGHGALLLDLILLLEGNGVDTV